MITQVWAFGGWFLAGLSWLGLLALHYPRPNLGGEQGMGYSLGLVACSLGFLLGLSLVAVALIRREGWAMPWAVFALAGVAGLALTVFVCGWLWAEPAEGFPWLLRALSQTHGLIWIPALTLVLSLAGWVMHREGAAMPVLVICGLGMLAALCLSGVAAWGALWLGGLPARQQVLLTEFTQEQSDRHQGNLEDIAAWQPEDGIVLLLALTGRYHDPEVREAAVSRIRSVPGWDEKLMELLEREGYAYQVYHFLDGNPVPHPEKFAGPLRHSILYMAGDIRAQIRDASNLQHWTFDYLGLDRLISALDGQFEGQKPILLPALREVQQALETTPPERFKGVRFDAARTLKPWLNRQVR